MQWCNLFLNTNDKEVTGTDTSPFRIKVSILLYFFKSDFLIIKVPGLSLLDHVLEEVRRDNGDGDGLASLVDHLGRVLVLKPDHVLAVHLEKGEIVPS